jgi:hypothetical protein
MDVIHGKNDDMPLHHHTVVLELPCNPWAHLCFSRSQHHPCILVKDRISVIVEQSPREYYDRVKVRPMRKKSKRVVFLLSFNRV